MSKRYKHGAWNVICDVCGFEFKSDEVQRRWDNLIVCKKDFEHDHPQKYLRLRAEDTSVPFVRPPPEDIFVEYCDILGSSGVTGYAVADCARADVTIDITL